MTYLEAGLEVLKLMHMNGYEAYFVGGFVRDHILGQQANDIDIATNALPEQISNIFKVIHSGIKYNCVTIIYENYTFEATTYRLEEEYHDNRHPVYKVASTLSSDLKRRDFTINAMAMDIDFNVIDLFGGLDDLNKEVIKTVNEPTKRFTEDALRMLRAAYFSAKLGFAIDKETLLAMKKCSYLVQNLSIDRITWELEKLINSKHYKKGIEYLVDTNIAPYLGGFKKGIYLVNEKNIDNLTWELFLSLSFYENVSNLKDIHFKKDITSIVLDVIKLAKENPKNNFDNIYLFENGYELCKLVNKVNVIINEKKDNELLIDKNYQLLPIKKMSDLTIKGQDIIDNINLKDNRFVGKILLDVRNLVLNNKIINEKEAILKYIRKHY